MTLNDVLYVGSTLERYVGVLLDRHFVVPYVINEDRVQCHSIKAYEITVCVCVCVFVCMCA